MASVKSQNYLSEKKKKAFYFDYLGNGFLTFFYNN